MLSLKRVNLSCKQLKACLKCEHGQASAEYVIALFVGLASVLILFGLLSYFSSAGNTVASHSAKTYSRAPYTLPSQGAVSEQWAKDLIIH
jgi:hypothetical protein